MLLKNRLHMYILLCLFWIGCLSILTIGKDQPISYKIYTDSNSSNSYIIKEHLLETYQHLMNGVSEESQISFLMDNLEIFQTDTMTSIAFQNQQLQVVIGDGLGEEISGYFDFDSLCLPKVKPKSLLAKFFQSLK